MSGGSYNYAYRHVEDMADDLRTQQSPLRRAFGEHLRQVAKAMKAVEWVDSSDWGHGQDEASIRTVLGECAELGEAIRAAKRAMHDLERLILRAEGSAGE